MEEIANANIQESQRHHAHGAAHRFNSSSLFTLENIIFMLLAIVIFALAIYFRTTMLQYFGFYEPDGFYHYAVIRAAVMHNFVVPKYLGISGWPQSTPVTEPQGLYWVTLIPYLFLQFVGITYYTIERWMALVFGLLTIVATYFFARLLSKDKFFALLAMILIALSMGDAARTSALIYRGDSFVSLFLLISIILVIYALKAKDRNKKIIYSVAAAFVLSMGNLVWNGASFTTTVYIFALLSILTLGFLIDDEKLIANAKYVFLTLAVWLVLVTMYTLIGFNRPEAFTGPYFVVIYVLLLIGWYLVYYLQRHKSSFSSITSTMQRRLLLVVLLLICAIAAIFVIPGFYNRILVENGFAGGGSFANTIQELAPPTYQFLYASFGPVLFTTPMSIIIALATFVYSLHFLFWIFMLASLLLYLFMQVYDSKGFLGGNARLRFELREEMLFLIAYFAITAFLQLAVIRFNSLVSIPLAIISAYTIYWLIIKWKGWWSYRVKISKHSVPLASILGVAIALLFVAVLIYTDTLYTQGLVQADSMNPQFFAAAAWLKNNTPTNSVILTLWPDGSVVEGIGNRTSVMDSVGAQLAVKAMPFARWIFNSSPDPQYLTSANVSKPDYLLVRYVWLDETSGIYTEANFTNDSSKTQANFGYTLFTGLSESVTAQKDIIRFTQTNQQGQLVLLAILNITNPSNSTPGSVQSYIESAQGLSPLSYVVLYDRDNGNYSVIQPTGFNKTNGEVLIATYSKIYNPQLPINFTSAYLFAGGIGMSNMLKFLYMCNSYSCIWNNNIATMQMVYSNSDTRIFKITYNSST